MMNICRSLEKAVLKNQDDDIQEKNDNKARTDVEQNSAKEKYGLEEKNREIIGNYELISYSNESYGNKTVFMEIIQAGHIIATITDAAALRELEDYEIHEVSFYNYEGGQIYQIGYEDVKEEYYETEIISRYDEYGNCLYWEDVCNIREREYDFADVNYQYIIRQCEEILNYNNSYRQSWE